MKFKVFLVGLFFVFLLADVEAGDHHNAKLIIPGERDQHFVQILSKFSFFSIGYGILTGRNQDLLFRKEEEKGQERKEEKAEM